MSTWNKSGLWLDVESHFLRLHEPSAGKPSQLMSQTVSPDGTRIVVTATTSDELVGVPRQGVFAVEADGELRALTDGESMSMSPQLHPDGRTLAYLDDAGQPGVFQLRIIDLDGDGSPTITPAVPGMVEYCSWSPDGRHVLLGVAGLDAELSGGQGGKSAYTPTEAAEYPAWYPTIDTGASEDAWRSLWVYDHVYRTVERLSPDGMNTWEAAWAGPDAVVVVASPAPEEAAWYSAKLYRITLERTVSRVFESPVQLGVPSGSPDGRRIAVSEAICSDRWLVAGDLYVGGHDSGMVKVPTANIDVTATEWIDDARLGLLGIRGLESVAAIYDATSGTLREVWASTETSSGLIYPNAAWTADGGLVMVEEGYELPPELVVLSPTGERRVIRSMADEGTDYLSSINGVAEAVSWSAPDGLEIQGILCKPDGDGPFPLVVHIHGGPVWAFRNTWGLMYPWTPLLVSRGYAVLNVNPRGSAGRGQDFARLVFGEMGGDDTHDFISGVDALVERGLIDPKRIGLTGASYGGYMSSWLVTQDDRWAAAVPTAPVINWYSQHYTSNIPHFDALFLDDDPTVPGGKFHSRSPVFHTANVKTPCLNIAGSVDLCTPPTQAQEFHQSLLNNGATSELVIYPGEGHGVRMMPAAIDYVVRMIEWFERYMPADEANRAIAREAVSATA